MTLVGGRSLYSTTVSAPKGRLTGVGLNYTTTYLETKILAVKASFNLLGTLLYPVAFLFHFHCDHPNHCCLLFLSIIRYDGVYRTVWCSAHM